jgi:pimeloyl-ACP methyl ester carboxylesterase
MSTITTKTAPGLGHSGWPLTGDAFEDQMFFLASRGYRCVAHDRRGQAVAESPPSNRSNGVKTMSMITTNDGAEIFYKDWGRGQPIVFHHGWPLSSDDGHSDAVFCPARLPGDRH